MMMMMMMMMKRRNFLRLLVNLPVLSLECTLPAQDFRLMQPDGEVDDEDGVEIYTLALTKFEGKMKFYQ